MGAGRFSMKRICLFIALALMVFLITACNNDTDNIPQKADPLVSWPTAGKAIRGMTLGEVAIVGGSADPSGAFTWTRPGEPVGLPGTRSFSMTFTPDNANDFNILYRFIFVTVEDVPSAVNIGTGLWPDTVLVSFESLISNNNTVIFYGDRIVDSGALILDIPAGKTVTWIANLTCSGTGAAAVELVGAGTLHIMSGSIKSNSDAAESGTIALHDTEVSPEPRLVISGGIIQNTALSANARAIYSSSAGSIHISGMDAKVIAAEPGARAIIRAADSAGQVFIAGDVPTGNITNRGAADWIIETEYWALYSDTHIDHGAAYEHLGNRPFNNFSQANAELLAQPKPKGFILTGDAASFEGRIDDYQQLKPFLDQITNAVIPVYVLMGNHDRFGNFKTVLPEYVFTANSGWQVKVLEGSFINLFLLDSHADIFSDQNARFGNEQLDWLTAELDKRSDKPAVLAAHYNISSQIQDLEQFWDIVKTRRQVKAYIHGHGHMYTQSVRDDVHLIALPSLGWGQWNVIDSVEPVGWTAVLLRPNGIELTLHAINKAHPLNNDVRIFNWKR